jgi:hypothetical protein
MAALRPPNSNVEGNDKNTGLYVEFYGRSSKLENFQSGLQDGQDLSRVDHLKEQKD